MTGATLADNQAIGGRGGDNDGFRHVGDGGSASGAGLYATGGSLDISGSMIVRNRATGGRAGDGGAYTTHTHFGSITTIYVGGRGGGAQGGGLYVTGGSLTLASSTIGSNQGVGGPAGVNGLYDGIGIGGGLYIFSNVSTVSVTGGTLSGNSVSGGNGGARGGGIENWGTLTVSNSTLSGNSATGGVVDGTPSGGGIDNYGTLTVSNSTLSGNFTSGEGGGIYTFGSRVVLTNVTLTANRASTSGGTFPGGGLFVASGAPALHNTLIVRNFRGATREGAAAGAGPVRS